MSHLFSLRRPRPVCFPWAFSAIFLTLHYHGLLLNVSSFLGSITLFLFLGSYTAHGLLFLSFRAPLSPFTSSRPICLSHEPVIHYSCRLGLMGFLSVCQLLSIRVAGLLLPTWASKMALNKELEGGLEEDDWSNWWILLSLELLGDSLSEWSSSRSLKISSFPGWSLTRVLIRDLALALHSFLKWPLFP